MTKQNLMQLMEFEEEVVLLEERQLEGGLGSGMIEIYYIYYCITMTRNCCCYRNNNDGRRIQPSKFEVVLILTFVHKYKQNKF
jgi:hypothetical protein